LKYDADIRRTLGPEHDGAIRVARRVIGCVEGASRSWKLEAGSCATLEVDAYLDLERKRSILVTSIPCS